MLHTVHLLSICITLALVTVLGIYAAKQVKSANDFSVGGRRLGTVLISSSLVGAFVGGTSTVGTAQVAYLYGISGIWFTLGAGLGCFFLASTLARPLREAEVETIPQLFETYYGRAAAVWSTFFISIGIIIQIAAQILSAIPMLIIIFNLNTLNAAIFFSFIIILYSIWGGMWSTGLVGLIKTFLLITTLLIAGFLGFNQVGDIGGLINGIGNDSWFTLFPHGLINEVGAVISVIIGFVSTQTYLQIIFSAKTVKEAQTGALIAGLLIPLTGIASTFIGIYMRITFPDIDPTFALPLFLINYLNPWLGGIALATLIISLVMTAAALTLGATTIITNNIYKVFKPYTTDKELLSAFRIFNVLIVLFILLFVSSKANSLILQWAFLSMAIRGVAIFLPLVAVIFVKEKINRESGKWAIIIAPTISIIWALFGDRQIDPLYPGLIISFLILAIGSYQNFKFDRALYFFRRLYLLHQKGNMKKMEKE
ncbi:MAG: sodium:solute symporter family protein [Bacillota bacterium]|nr:sodium:solute symporter family protein [Bacillota bacterium]